MGRSPRGLTRKIHTVVDRGGLPFRFVLTLGQASDKTTVPELVEPLTLRGDVVADGGYFGRAVTEAIQALGATARYPSQRNVRVVRSVDRELLPLPQSDRALLQPTQKLPRHRHPILQDRGELPLPNPPRSRASIDQSL
ncbi:MAG: transposase [Agrobacterium tumefaciens]